MQERGTRGTAMTKWPPTDLQRCNTQVDRGLALGAANSMGRSVISSSAMKSLGATFHVWVLGLRTMWGRQYFTRGMSLVSAIITV
jgi:hypothetical protein